MTTHGRLRIAGSLILSLGLLVGVAAGVGLALGIEPARLPAVLLNIAAYKLAFVTAGGLLAAGAIIVRYARREADVKEGDRPERARELREPREPDGLSNGGGRNRSRSRVRRQDPD